jgi:hypothetical protein
MPIYNPPLSAVDKEETRRYAGLRGAVAFPEPLLDRACAEAQLFARPRAVWHIYPYDAAAAVIAGPLPLRLAGAVARHLAGAAEVAVLAVTIGGALEEEAQRLFVAGEYTAGLLLDAAGTTAVEAAADAADAFIADQAARRGLSARSRFSPGYGDWAVTDQPLVTALADACAIGLKVTASCMLVPRKSVTAVIGLAPAGRDPDDTACRQGCAGCPQSNCPARKEL